MSKRNKGTSILAILWCCCVLVEVKLIVSFSFIALLLLHRSQVVFRSRQMSSSRLLDGDVEA